MDPASPGPGAGVWVVLGVTALVTAFAAFADAALGGINRARVQRMLEEGVPRARAIIEALDHPNRYAITLLLLGSVGIVGYTVAGVDVVLNSPEWGVALRAGVAVALLLALGFCQVTARAVAVINAESSFGWVLAPLDALGFVLSPFTAVVVGASQVVLRLTGADRHTPAPLVTEDDLRVLVSRGQEEGVIEADERQMIQGVFELEDTSAREIMVPRIDMAAIQGDDTVAELAALIVARGYSRIPVYEGSVDEIIGVAYAKDALKYLLDGHDHAPVRQLVRTAHFIPESKRINELLHELQSSRVHMAIVVDEYGGTAGLVTIEDLLEEIVGEIRDEYDVEEEKIVRVDEREALFASTVSIEDVNDTLGLRLTGEDFDTIGGLVYDRLGKVPTAGDVVELEDGRVTVVSTSGRRIRQVRVERIDRAGDGDADEVAATSETNAPANGGG